MSQESTMPLGDQYLHLDDDKGAFRYEDRMVRS